ncbi:MAG: hypothetical protein GTN57_02695 [Acidobacteria bacterium]|nr:hypothetical protein [Acidobacteriota bacterium]NIT10022.1 hypothetical protein [Acidobacteriota bacterium]
MNYRSVVFLLGRLLLVLAATLTIPGGVALAYGESVAAAFLESALIVGAVGALVEVFFRTDLNGCFGRRDAFMLVAAAWLVATLVGALPYVLIKGPSFIVYGLF